MLFTKIYINTIVRSAIYMAAVIIQYIQPIHISDFVSIITM